MYVGIVVLFECDYFSPIDVMFRISIIAHQMNLFLFLLLLCKFPFDGPKLLEVMVVLLPGENSKCQFLRQYEHP